MRIYLLKTDDYNSVVVTNGETAKIFDCAPSGKYEGIDIYADDAIDRLKDFFEEQKDDMNDFNDIWCENEIPFSNIKNCDLIEIFWNYNRNAAKN